MSVFSREGHSYLTEVNKLDLLPDQILVVDKADQGEVLVTTGVGNLTYPLDYVILQESLRRKSRLSHDQKEAISKSLGRNLAKDRYNKRDRDTVLHLGLWALFPERQNLRQKALNERDLQNLNLGRDSKTFPSVDKSTARLIIQKLQRNPDVSIADKKSIGGNAPV